MSPDPATPHKRPVFLLHGLGRRAASMAAIARALDPETTPILFGYPSLTSSIETHARRLAEAFASQPPGEIDVVTHSMGAIVLRELLANGPHHWRTGRRIGHVAMIAPPNQGAAIARWLPVPPGPGALATLRRLGSATPAPPWTGEARKLTVIFGAAGRPNGFNPLLPGEDDGTVRLAEALIPDQDRLVMIGPDASWPQKARALHSFLPAHPGVIQAVRAALARPRLATGKDLAADLGRPGPPGAIATTPRRRTIQPRRNLDGSRR